MRFKRSAPHSWLAALDAAHNLYDQAAEQVFADLDLQKPARVFAPIGPFQSNRVEQVGITANRGAFPVEIGRDGNDVVTVALTPDRLRSCFAREWGSAWLDHDIERPLRCEVSGAVIRHDRRALVRQGD